VSDPSTAPLTKPQPSREIAALLAIMAALRHPETGCQWDLEQDFSSIAPYTIEEAYEVADAIARGEPADIRDELGDLLLQVVFQARIAEERGLFDFGGVVESITAKLIRRHPHVFGDARDLSPAEVKALWDEIKQAERQEKTARQPHEPAAYPSVLDGVPASLPPLPRALKLTRKAASVGFTWPDAASVLDKVEEELGEVRDALSGDRSALEDELGDLLFVVTNLARQLEIDPETALASANRKFERRFRFVEQGLAAAGSAPERSTLAEMDALWDEAKAAERAGGR
jgi:nucleoside triphosphate diphosphatase